MNASSALKLVVTSTAIFAALGTLVGFVLGRFLPNYYRGVIRNGDLPEFDPVAVGVGQGVTQGITGGIVVGLILVLIATWSNTRHTQLRGNDVKRSGDQL